MPRLALNGGAYQARSVIASAQRSLNLYAEPMPQQQGEPSQFAHYPTPGLTLFGTLPQAPIRGIRQATNDAIYVAAGSGIYHVTSLSPLAYTLLGSITPGLTTPVSMQDNMLTLVIVDGSTNGWTVDLASNVFAQIPIGSPTAAYLQGGTISQSSVLTTLQGISNGGFEVIINGISFFAGPINFTSITSLAGAATLISPYLSPMGTCSFNSSTGTFTITSVVTGSSSTIGVATAPSSGTDISSLLGLSTAAGATAVDGYDPQTFGGSNRVDYLDTYLLFTDPTTHQFYSSNSLSVTFDKTYVAKKSSYPDNLVVVAVAKREIWLIGERTTEIWYNAGTGDFWASPIPSTFVDHGCIAQYSVAVYDNSLFWLTLDRQGAPLLMQGAGYQTKRVSTFALEETWTNYGTVADAIGYIYLIGGHAIYVLSFPTADHTWCYDISTGLWHEWLWVDGNGNEHRSRCSCAYPMTTGVIVGGDWQNGNLYQITHAAQTDNGQPIKRQRSWPHVLNDGKRVFHREFVADFETGMDGPAPSQPATMIECLFNGPDGTLVEQYSPAATEINASWSLVSGAGAELANGAAIAANGDTTYASGGPFPPIADYSVAFRALANAGIEVNGSSALVGVRTSSTGIGGGYWGGIQIYNGQWYAQLAGTEVPVGPPAPDGWFDCLMTAVGSTMSLTVQRSQDGLYLAPSGLWQSTAAAVITVTDSTYTAPGRIMFGLNAIPTGVMGTEDATGTWVLEDGSGSSWEWDDVPTDSLAIDNIVANTLPSPWLLYLDWSDDRGHTFGNPVQQSMGGQGEYLTSVQWQRLGHARDRVWRLTWTAPVRTALQGCWFEAQPGLS